MKDIKMTRQQLIEEVKVLRIRVAELEQVDESERGPGGADLARLATFPENNPNPVIEVDLKGHVTYLNPAARLLFPDLGAGGSDRSATGPHHPWLNDWESVIDRFQAEKVHSLTREVAIDDSWYQQVMNKGDNHIRIYGLDITGRKQAEDALRASEGRYRELVQNANSAIIRWSSDGTISFFNEYAQALFGYGSDEIIGKNVSILVPETESNGGDLTGLADDILAHPERYISNVNENIRRDGSRLWMAWTNKPILDANGQVSEILAIGMDVTARKEAEKALRRSEELFSKAFHSNPALMTIARQPDGFYLEANESFLRTVECSREEVIGHTGLDLNLIDAEGRAEIMRQLRQEGTVHNVEVQAKTKSGRPLSLLTSIESVELGGEPCTLAIMLDITERKQAEEALRESQMKFQNLVETTSDFFWEMNPDGAYTYCSPQIEELWGFKPEDMLGKSPFDLLPPEDREQGMKRFSTLLKAASSFENMEVRSFDSSGRIVFLEINGIPVFDPQGTLCGYRGTSRDITERKQAEMALRESEQRFRRAIKEAPFPIIMHAEGGEVITISDMWLDLTGYTFQDISTIAKWTKKAYGEGAHQVKTGIDKLYGITEKTHEGEFTITTSHGTTRTWDFSSTPLGALPDGRRLALSMAVDVTEHKRAEEALQRSEEVLQKAQELAHLGSWELDLADDRLTWSDEVYRIFGLEPQEFGATYEAFLSTVHPDDRAAVDDAYSGSLRDGRDVYEIEHRVIRKTSGEVRYVHERCEHLRDRSGRVVRSIGMVHDITERKQAEMALQESEERFRRAIKEAPFPIMMHAEDGEILATSDAWLDLTGYAPEDIPTVDRWLEKAYGEGHGQLEADVINRLYSLKEKSHDGEYTVATSHGTTLIWDFSATPLGTLPDGRRLVLTMAVDVTERKQAEEALRESEGRFRRAIKEAPFPIMMHAEDGEVIALSDTWLELTGYTFHDISTMDRWAERAYGEGADQVKADIDRLYGTTEKTYGGEFTITTSHDTARTWDFSSTPLGTLPDGRRLALSMAVDITERKQAEESLRVSETRYRRLFEAAQDGILILDAVSGQITAVNPFLIKMLGFPQEELLGRALWEIGPFKNIAASRAAFLELQAEGYIRYENLPLETSGGQLIDVEFISNVYLVNHSKVVQCNIRDITKRKQAEMALRESEERFRRAIKEAPFPIMMHAEDGEILALSDAWLELTGYASKDIPTVDRWLEKAYGERADQVKAIIDSLYGPDSKQKVGETTLTTSRDRVLTWDLSTTPLGTLPDGRRLVLSMAVDITERKQAEESLRVSETRYRRLFEAAQDGILILDAASGQITAVNPFLIKMLGFSQEELLGKALWEIGPFKNIAASRIAFLKLQTEGYIRYENLPLETSGGQLIDVEFISNVYLVNHSKVVQCNIRDITKRKQAEMALRESEERFRRAIKEAPFPIMMHAEDGEVVALSDTWLDLTGYAFQDISTTAKWTGKAFGERAGQVKASTDRLYGITEKTHEGEFTITTSHGKALTWDFSSTPLGTLPDGRHLALSMAVDVTERKQAEEALRESEGRFRRAIKEAPLPILMHAEGGEILAISDAWIELTGYAFQDISTIARWTEKAFGERAAQVKANIDRLYGLNSKQKVGETTLTTNYGTVLTWDLSTTPLGTLPDGRRLVLSMAMDITERKQAEEALRESEERFRRAIKEAPLPIMMYAEGGEILALSDVWLELTGYAPEDVSTIDRWLEKAFGERRDQVKADIDRLYGQDRNENEGEYTIATKHGASLVWDFSTTPLGSLPDGRRLVLSMAVDVTERKLAETLLRESEERFRRAIWEAPFPIMMHAEDGEVIALSDTWLELTGYTSQDISTIAKWTERAFGERAALVRAEIDRLYGLDTKVREGEYTITTSRGHTLTWDYSSTPLGALPDRRRLVLSMAVDITERKQMEETLLGQNEYLTALQETMLDLVSQLDLSRLLENIVKRASQLMHTPSGFLGLVDPATNQIKHQVGLGTLSELIECLEDTGDDIVGIVWRTGKPMVANDYTIRRQADEPDQQTVCSVIGVPLLSGSHVVGVLVLAYDAQAKQRFGQEDIDLLTQLARLAAIAIENAQLVEALRHTNAELQASNDELNAFGHTVAHDLKNPLSSIIGFANLLTDEENPLPMETIREMARSFEELSLRMDNIIEELMLLAGLRKAVIKMRPLDMAHIVAEAQRRLTYMIKNSRAEIVEPSSWPRAMGYAPWVEEIWINYISNAIKYGGQPPHIELGAVPEGDQVRFWVRDNGKGLTDEQKARLFRPFERLDQIDLKGHGLGLSIVQRITERMDGHVHVESAGAPGEGSTFGFALPTLTDQEP